MSLNVLNQIASEVGVTRWTVSRVLRGEVTYKQPKAAARAERIRRLAAEHGYRPNAAAKAVGRGRFDMIALLSDAEESEYLSPQLLFGLQNEVRERKQHLVLERLSSNIIEDATALPRVLEQASCDALMFHSTGPLPEEMARAVASARLPFLWINSKLPMDCIYLDDLNGARKVTRHLLKLGHIRVTLVMSELARHTHPSVLDRRRGYEQVMRKAGLEPQIIELRNDVVLEQVEDASTVFSPLLSGDDRPTALIAVDHGLAGLTLVQCLRAGLRVPDDVSIMGFGSMIRNTVGVPIAVAVTPDAEMGRRAVQMAMQKVAEPDAALPAVKLPLSLKPEATVAPPPARVRRASSAR
jgi:LacI family transcriptional regulator